MTTQTLLIGNTRGDNVLQFNAKTGEFIGQFIDIRGGGLSNPDTLLYGPDVNSDGFHDLYIASGDEFGNSGAFEATSVRIYDGLSGAFLRAFVADDISTAEDETGGLIRPYGLAFGPDGNLYVSSFRSDEILRYDGVTGAFIDVFAAGTGTANGLNGPNGLLFVGDQLYVTTQGSVADANGNIQFLFDSQILRYDSLAAGATPVIFAPQPTPSPDSFGFVSFLGLDIGPDGDLYVSDFANDIRRYNLTTGALVESLATNYTTLTPPSNNFIGGLVFGPNGELYVAGFDVNSTVGAVLRYESTTGSPTEPFSVLVEPNSRQRSIGITFTPSGDKFLVGNTRGDNVYQFNTTTGEFLGEFITLRRGGLSNPDTLLYGPDLNNDGNLDLYVASGDEFGNSGEFGAAAVLVYDGVTGEFLQPFVQDDAATSTDETGGLIRPYGLAFGPDGNLYVSSFRSDEILRYNGTTGAFIDVFAAGTGTANGLNGPNGLLFINGQLYVTTQGSVADAQGNISFNFDSQILRYNSLVAGAAPVVFAPQPTPDPASFGFVSFLGLAVGPDGDLYASDFANSVRRYNLNTGALVSTLPTNYTSTPTSSNFIGSLAFDAMGDLYVVGFDVNTEVGAVLRYDGTSGSPTAPFELLVEPNSRQRSIGIVLPPSVNLSAGNSPAEAGTTKGSYKIKLRHPAPTGGLVVNYQLGGTATNLTDYQLQAGTNITALTASSFTIAPNATEATLEVLPVNDALIDPGETVELTLLDGTGYTIPGYSTTPLTILDNDGIPFTSSSNNLFTIGGDANTQVNLLFTLASVNASFINEIGVFIVEDDQGTINGLRPGQAGYLQAALSQGNIICSVIPNPPNGFNGADLSSLLSFRGNQRLVFYLVANGTTDTFLRGNGSASDILLASTFSSNSFSQLQISQTTSGFTLSWEDQVGGGDNSFDDLVLNVQLTDQAVPIGAGLQNRSQGEVLDLRSLSGAVQGQFTINREASFNNFVGFYRVTGVDGGIDTNSDGVADLLPGDAGYAQAAIQQRVAGIDLTTSNQTTTTLNGEFTAGSIFAPFLIANGTPDLLLDGNPSNDPNIYFPYLAANADGVDHIRLLANNVFGFEDLPNGGDFDYNDIIVRVAIQA